MPDSEPQTCPEHCDLMPIQERRGTNLGQYYVPRCDACALLIDPYRWGWRRRELGRLADDTYRRPPGWIEAEWYRPSVSYSHYLHVCRTDPRLIAYTQSSEKGRADIQTPIKPGRYLARFYPELTPTQVAEIVARYDAERLPPQLQLATDPDDIVRVYRNGPRSCMAGSQCVGVYGAGDLAIAYLEAVDDEITARALCWPERKVYGRVYGDAVRLVDALHAAGYAEAPDRAFNGARLLKEQAPGEAAHCYTLPYLDRAYGVEIGDEYLTLIQYGGVGQGTQAGYVTGEPAWRCDHCNGAMTANDDSYTVDGDDWCEGCVDDAATRCEGCEDATASAISVQTAGRNWIELCEVCASDAVCCDRCNKWWEADAIETDPDTLECVCDACLRPNRCAGCGFTAEPVYYVSDFDGRLGAVTCSACEAAALQLPLFAPNISEAISA